MPGLFKRSVLEREVTGLVQPEPTQLPLGPPPITGNIVPQQRSQIEFPPELQTQTIQIQGPNRGINLIGDFLTGFGGGPQAALQQQAQRATQTERLFQAQQRPIDLQTQLVHQNFQRNVSLRRLGFEERRVALREREAARPKISTFQSRDGRRLFTVNTQTGELVSSLNLSEPLSPQVLADFISNFENALGSPLNPNEQAIISAAGQSALQQGDLSMVSSALDGIASGREGFRRSRVLSQDVGKRQLFSDQRRAEREQAKNDRLAVQAERSAILVENKEIRKQINTLKRDLFIRRDMRGSQRKQVEVEIKRLTGRLAFNDSQIKDLDKQILQLSGKKSLLRKRGTEEQPKKTLRRITPTQPGTAEEFIRTESGKP